jgi:predicted secreted protein
MALAAHPSVLDVSTDDITYNEVDGINDYTFGLSRDVLETTDFKDTSGAHTRILGLQDIPVSISGDFEGGDTNGQNVIRAAFVSGATIYFRLRPDGTNGYKVQCKVSTFEISAGVADKVEFSCELVSTSAVTAVP